MSPGGTFVELYNPASADIDLSGMYISYNAPEAIALEYSRYNNYLTDYHDETQYRSSNHDPVKIGIDVDGDEPTDGPTVTPTGNGPSQPSSSTSTKPGSELPNTGANVAGVAIIAVFLVATGGVLVARRRSQA